MFAVYIFLFASWTHQLPLKNSTRATEVVTFLKAAERIPETALPSSWVPSDSPAVSTGTQREAEQHPPSDRGWPHISIRVQKNITRSWFHGRNWDVSRDLKGFSPFSICFMLFL